MEDSEMNDGKPTWVPQGVDEILIAAAPERVLALLQASQRLPL
jgi:hypothetical protein